jgi:hypothetical protein
MLVTSMPPFHGEIKCQHPAGCRFNAYYESPPNTFVCGQHSKKRPRTALHKDPDAKVKRQKKITKLKQMVTPIESTKNIVNCFREFFNSSTRKSTQSTILFWSMSVLSNQLSVD